MLSELQRQPGVDRVELSGLALDDCVTMAQGVANEMLDSTGVEFVQALGEATSGNPFFLGEIVRSLKEAGGVASAVQRGDAADRSALEIPPSVRDAIARQ